ncbi:MULTISPECIES: competence/damage-inducible protein A [Sphingobacterium]|uniref:competence/damage-inducible protein A n=1 Tax=Sphingobacterium TaxID=28453 RepID=UPI00104762E4|nr:MULTISPECIES: competence/damage-inducible protein A [Sphingobacterium]MCW2261112.1 nicotinamide-nucleotide amidase [Sphingobacterium kitahiroshimense]TCR08252.1 nicotinamide-nucleotide amidase [Sphingobacterium sp. JUb78]
MKAQIITIGDEILIGQIIDTNSAWIATQLQNNNISVTQILSISDKEEAIFNALSNSQDQADVVLITGGLGPTKDDITKQTATKYFDTFLQRDEEVLQHVTQFFEARGKEMLEINRQQADVLKGCTILFNQYGTAPGMLIKKGDTAYIFMPGVPFEMKHLMNTQVLPILCKQDNTTYLAQENIIVGGIGESYLAEKIADLESELPAHIKLAYLPTLAFVRLRLSGTGSHKDDITKETKEFASKLIDRLADHVIANHDTSIEKFLIQKFISHRLTLTTAESCTGGSLAAMITAVPGCSAMYVGGTVPYSNKLKQQLLDVREETLSQYGAVSEQTVIEMAQGAKYKFDTNYAVATSGIAGPTGGTPEKPVGTVWIAIAGEKETIARKFQFQNDRTINIERTRQLALFMLWQLLVKEHQIGIDL